MSCVWCTSKCNNFLCSLCFKLKKRIRMDPETILECYPNAKLEVVYSCTQRCHDGYCSDHVYNGYSENDFTQITSERTFEFPVPLCMNLSHFDEEELIEPHLRSLYKKSPRHEINGWCDDCQTYFEILSCRLIKNGDILSDSAYNWRKQFSPEK